MTESSKTPVHFWIVAIISLLWNAVGAFDYTASKLKLDFYMNQFTPEQLEYFYGFPAWAVATWAVGVWGSFLGSVGLVLRQKWAVFLFGASIAGLAGTTVYNFILTDGAKAMGDGSAIFSGVIWLIALFLFFYSRTMASRGVLR